MNAKEIIKKLGVKLNILPLAAIRGKGEDFENTIAFFQPSSGITAPPDEEGWLLNELHPELDPVGKYDFVLLHELSHWARFHIVDPVHAYIRRLIAGGADMAMEEIAADVSAETLEEDLHGNTNFIQPTAQRIDEIGDLTKMPTKFRDEAISNGIEAAHFIEERLKDA